MKKLYLVQYKLALDFIGLSSNNGFWVHLILTIYSMVLMVFILEFVFKLPIHVVLYSSVAWFNWHIIIYNVLNPIINITKRFKKMIDEV